MSHKYYSGDTEQRKDYFDKQFLSYAKDFASKQGLTLNEFLSRINDFNSFKETLEISWSQDSSLSSYFYGMGDEELLEFFERPVIQRVLNLEEYEEKIIPDYVYQKDKKVKSIFLGKIKERKTGKMLKVFARKGEITIKGKKMGVYRDSRGRFVSVKRG